jgi:hypothetical protein
MGVWPELDDDDAMRHACGFEFPSELALARLGLDLHVVGSLYLHVRR